MRNDEINNDEVNDNVNNELNDDKRLIVDGFVFPDYKEAQLAIKEQSNIQIIKEQTNINRKEDALELYTKLVQRELFKTVIGYSYLFELRSILIYNFSLDPDELPNVELPKQTNAEKADTFHQNVMEAKIESLTISKQRLLIVVFALIFMIASMFFIVSTNENIGYINTENKILNKYSAWQETLEQKEKELQEKEAQIEERENK